MEQYQDVPMDYADATLVVVAEDVATNRVFTLDKRGFSTYRIRGKELFEIAP